MEIKILIITHENMGCELLKTAFGIIGQCYGVEIFAVRHSEKIEKIREDFKIFIEDMQNEKVCCKCPDRSEEIRYRQKESGILILTDMPGGTPTNLAVPFVKNDSIEIVTGVNLPMLITALHKKKIIKSVKSLAGIVKQSTLKSILSWTERIND